jgi:glutathione S-transferase
MHLYTALITALTVALMFAAMMAVGRARTKFGIKAPATTGHPDFERAFRVQMNTLEQVAMFLPALWLASVYSNERIATALGAAWLVGRVWYHFGYLKAAGKRGAGFMIGAIALAGLWGIGSWSIVVKLVESRFLP